MIAHSMANDSGSARLVIAVAVGAWRQEAQEVGDGLKMHRWDPDRRRRH
jgi:hypothetical protein